MNLPATLETNEVYLFQRLAEDEYLVYTKPSSEKDGRFVQDLGGIVWVSEANPGGIECRTTTITGAQYRAFMKGVEKVTKGRER
jgi:hypothetical protein